MISEPDAENRHLAGSWVGELGCNRAARGGADAAPCLLCESDGFTAAQRIAERDKELELRESLWRI
jgi:hypothetical protein